MPRLVALLLPLALAGPLAADDKPFFFQKGDRVVFLGDSITEQYQYSSYLELYLTTRFPDGGFTFLNAGIGGDRAVGGDRFQDHVLAEKPTAITINFGMNDAGYGKFDPALNKVYVEKTTAMLEAAKAAGVRVARFSPNAVDRRVQEKFKLYVETQKEFYAPLKGLAEKSGMAFVDQYALTRAATERMEADDPKAAKVKPYYDGFHTSPPGGLLMAHAILTGLNAPAKVSDADVDAASKAAKGDNCEVTDLNVAPDAVSFRRLDKALPLPVQPDWRSVLPYVNELKDLNYYGLTVKGLTQGIWELRIDGKPVGKFGADQLAMGVNLGNLTVGPIFEQSQTVLRALTAKNQLVHARFRGVMLNPNLPAEQKDAARKALLPAIDAAQKAVYEIAKPTAHTFELKLTKS